MNKKFAILIVVITGIFLAGCDHASHTDSHDAHKSHLNAEHRPLVLNQGQRWETDDPTRAGMRELKAKVETFKKKDQAQSQDFKDLADVVKGDVNTILQKCTMTGAGHTELHKYIAAVLRDAEGLRSRQPEQAESAFKKLEAELQLFDRYFQ